MLVLRREQMQAFEEAVNEEVARAALAALARDFAGRVRVPAAGLEAFVRRAVTAARGRGLAGRRSAELYAVLAALHGPRFPDIPPTRWVSRLLATASTDEAAPEDLFVLEAERHLGRLASEDACRATPPSSPAPTRSGSS